MEDSFELRFGDEPFPKRVVVLEELPDADSFHDDFALDFLLDLVKVLIVLLEFLGGEEGGDEVQSLTVIDVILVGVDLPLVLFDAGDDALEHFLDVVDIIAELDVVHFFGVAIVDVPPDQQVEVLLLREQVQLGQHARELLDGDVRAPCSIEVLEGLFQQDPFRLDLPLDGCEQLVHPMLLLLAVHLRRLEHLSFGLVVDELLVDLLTEVRVLDQPVLTTVPLDDLLDVLGREEEVYHRKCRTELILCHPAFP